MNFKDKYIFDDFTIKNYAELVRIANERYTFTTHDEPLDNQKYIIWRHDLEFSPETAVRMSAIEKSFNVVTTYFVNLHSEFYNIFQRETHQLIVEIQKNGHKLGLHFDCHFYNLSNENKLDVLIAREKNIIENLFQTNIKSFSFHNLNEQIKQFEKECYGGLINVYNSFFKTQVDYCTDSTGYWRYERLEDKLKDENNRNLQILIHDGMWQDEILPPRQRILKVINNHAEKLKTYYDYTMKEFGASNIDWDKIL